MMLHLIYRFSQKPEAVARIAAADDVVLMQGMSWAICAASADSSLVDYLLSQSCQVYVLQEMLTLYGIDHENRLPAVQIIDYQGLVALSVKNTAIQTWN
jgi:tRNA 2-thiouridine synthesizing protein B